MKKPISCSGCGRTIFRQRARKDAECKLCLAASKHQWYLDHRQERLAAELARYHAGVKTATIRAWRAAHPEKLAKYRAAYQQRQRQLVKEVECSLPCLECGVSHARERRQAVIRRALPATREEIIDAWPCFWQGTAGQARLERDLHSMGAYSHKWIWQMRSAA